MRRLTAVAASGTAALVAVHWHVHRAAHAIPAWAFVAAVAIHVATLAGRSEAWRLVLAAVTGDPLPRVAVHGANAAAFGAGIVQSQAALAVRVRSSRVWSAARSAAPTSPSPMCRSWPGRSRPSARQGPPGSDLRLSSGSW